MNQRDRILALDDRRTEMVYVKEWNETIIVRSMSAQERTDFETANEGAPRSTIPARLVVATAVGEDGSPLFTEADVPALSGKNAAAMLRLFEAASKLNALSGEDVEEISKN